MDSVLIDCAAFLSPAAFCGKDRPCGLRHNSTLRNLLNIGAVLPDKLPVCPEWIETGDCPRGLPCAFYHPTASLAPSSSTTPLPTLAVDVFWDTENCHLPFPPQPSQPSAAETMRSLEHMIRVVTGASGPVTIHAYHRQNLRDTDKTSLRSYGANVIDTGIKENSVDNKLKDDLYEFVIRRLQRHIIEGVKPPPAWAVLVSGDRDFADAIRNTRSTGVHTCLIYNDVANTDFTGMSDVSLTWDSVLTHASFAADRFGRAVAATSHVAVAPVAAPPKKNLYCKTVTTLTGPAATKIVCQYYLKQSCTKGFNCVFAHPCGNFSRGTCPYAETCKYDHVISMEEREASLTPPRARKTISPTATTTPPASKLPASVATAAAVIKARSAASAVTQVKTTDAKAAARLTDPRCKTALCQHWASSGSCPFGTKCVYAHGVAELRTK